MPVRLGIELSPIACRIVELDVTRGFGLDGSDTRVRSFARLPRESVATRLRLSRLRRQPAGVVVWGLQADHRQLVVEHGSLRAMRHAAVTALRNAGVETRGKIADIVPVPRKVKGGTTRSVISTFAPTQTLATAARWLTDEGVRVQSIVTPALALMSLARLRRASTAPGLIDGYVALEETSTALVLVRDGALVAASELEWGYQDERGYTRTRGEIARQLSDEIEVFLAACGARVDTVSQVCVCGGLPELRSMTVALMERLDVEVEPLDSLFAINAEQLPELGHEFREYSAELRMAWAVAADWPSPLNLLRERKRRQTRTVLTRAAVVAGAATGVGVAWQIQRSDWWQSSATSPPPASERPAGPAQMPAAIPLAVRRPPATTPLVAPSVPPVQVQAARSALPVAPPTPPLSPPSPNVRAVPRRFELPPPTAVTVPAFEAPRPSVARAEPAPAVERPVAPPAVQPAVQPPAAQPTAGNQRQQVAARRASTRDPETPLPFDAVLGTILYAPERKLAIIDGRIVQPGDDVRGARVVDITPTSVLLRDAQGRLRRLTLGLSAP
jgi:hypothetical protein